MFKKGDEVFYVSGRFGDARNNPLWDGMHGFIKGTITSTEAKGKSSFGDILPYWVKWENGTTNTYAEKDLGYCESFDCLTGGTKSTILLKFMKSL